MRIKPTFKKMKERKRRKRERERERLGLYKNIMYCSQPNTILLLIERHARPRSIEFMLWSRKKNRKKGNTILSTPIYYVI